MDLDRGSATCPDAIVKAGPDTLARCSAVGASSPKPCVPKI
jgi:hypothetical protein